MPRVGAANSISTRDSPCSIQSPARSRSPRAIWRSRPAAATPASVAMRYFAAEKIELATGDTVDLAGAGGPQVFTCLAGSVDVRR